ncbi:MAG TPA: enoyl-CoA hydratase-related protein [Polyangiaceae bacterium]|nr:enoyl-CoA hydratase-related protein [Polyangiaceae bacterium]
MTRAYERIKVGRDGAVETIALSYPERRNAIGPRMASELLWALEDARAADDVRAIVLTGEGDAFCAGGDFAEITTGVTDWKLPRKGDVVDLWLALFRSDKPVIARVNGHALGGGLGLAAASTFAVASTMAKLGTPEIDVGLFPMTIMAVLARQVPRRRMLEMMLLGETFGAEEAARLGLVNRAVAPDRLDAEVKTITDAIIGKSPSAVRLGLRAFAAQDDLDLEQALLMLRERLAECIATDDAREGLQAFLEKRRPRWKEK